MTNRKNIKLNQISHKFYAVLIITAILLPIFSFTMVAAEEQTYQDISIDIVNEMIENKKKNPNLVILDVRTECEYEKGHLYDALFLPHDELESRLSELEEYKDIDIIVYCKAGGRSQQASQILSQNGFAKVHNMLGGIIAWLDVDYPIYTSFHYVTVDKMKNKPIIQIDPLIKSSYICCSSANQPNQTNIERPQINSTILVDEENYSETQMTIEYNNTVVQSIWKKTLLYNYEEVSNKANKTINFSKTQILTNDLFMEYYTLNYNVQHFDYNLTVLTILIPMDTQTYNRSSTTIIYVPVNKSEISVESVKFNFSTTLSEQYKILGKVAQEIGKVYQKSKDETLMDFTKGYRIIAKETKHLSKLVANQLQEYDYQILESRALLLDYDDIGGGGGGGGGVLDCPLCLLVVEVITIGGCALAIAIYPLSYFTCMQILAAMHVLHFAHAVCHDLGYC